MERNGKHRFQPVLIEGIINLYEKNTRIKIGSKLTEKSQTTKGLRQDCCLSPTLFKLHLDTGVAKKM
jgi:hypothetical protein